MLGKFLSELFLLVKIANYLSVLETRWPNLLQEVKGVRFRAMKKIKKLIEENIAKYVKIFAPKTVNFVGAVKKDFGETSF
ncbi:MAG: hypothetical protein P8N41_03065 [Alphaproteobacteria bacterium]|nr:hypothetical protein [Alphaproteobacteria bacterium]